MKKIILFILLLFLPSFSYAAENSETEDQVFKAEVIEVVEEKESEFADGSISRQQNIRLKGLSGDFQGQDIFFEGISDLAVVGEKIYQEGDEVLVVASPDEKGNTSFYITDHARGDGLLWLFLLFAAVLLVIGRNKGLRAIVSLILTFFIIVKFIVPAALSGSSLILPTLISSIVILAIIIYLTEGFGQRSHVAVISTAISLVITVAISWIFVEVSELAGLGSEEIAHLVNIGSGVINFKGLLLSGIIIGALGVMDDVIISQVAAVEQIYKTNRKQSNKEVFSKAMDIGVSHISSMTNTLFLAYAGASLPLLILFSSGQSAFASWTDIINNEVVATEIVRALSGSIGLILAVPISTYLAVWWFRSHNA